MFVNITIEQFCTNSTQNKRERDGIDYWIIEVWRLGPMKYLFDKEGGGVKVSILGMRKVTDTFIFWC